MICAYDRVYLESARRNLARMLDFAVYDMCYDLQQFYHWFLMSGIAEQFGSGDYRFLAGMSGVELAYEVLDDHRSPMSAGNHVIPRTAVKNIGQAGH